MFKMKDLPLEKKSVRETGIKPGQLYAAQRNGPVLILTCECRMADFVVARETTVAFSPAECFLLLPDLNPEDVAAAKKVCHETHSAWVADRIRSGGRM